MCFWEIANMVAPWTFYPYILINSLEGDDKKKGLIQDLLKEHSQKNFFSLILNILGLLSS